MTPFELWMVAGMTLVTFGVRYPVLLLVSRTTLPRGVLGALKFIPTAVLTAIVVPAVVMPAGEVTLSLGNAYLAAGVISAFIAWRTRNLLLTIVAGMLFFLLWRWLL